MQNLIYSPSCQLGSDYMCTYLPHNSCNPQDCYYYYWFPILGWIGPKLSISLITFKLIYFFDRWCSTFSSFPFEWLSFYVHSIQLRLFVIVGCGSYKKFLLWGHKQNIQKVVCLLCQLLDKDTEGCNILRRDECDGETCLLIKSSWHDGGYKWSSSSWGVLTM